MKSSLLAKFETIAALLSEIKKSSEWTEHCTKFNSSLALPDANYAVNEQTFASLENDVTFLSESVANNEFESVNISITREDFDQESESASTPFIWNLIG